MRRLQSQLRQQQQRRQQAARKLVRDYNDAVRRYNRAADEYSAEARRRRQRLQQAVNDYNRRVQAHNTQVKQNRERLQRELNSMAQRPNTTGSVTTYRAGVSTVVHAFERLDAAARSGGAMVDDELLRASSQEAANSVGLLNRLEAEPDERGTDDAFRSQESTIDPELRAVDADLAERWAGALFALHPSNPDAARHFCTSAREMLSTMLELVAPDDDVLAADPDCPRTPQGSISRRARIRHCLLLQGHHSDELEEFAEADLANVLSLFGEFNCGTHGSAGRYELGQLIAIKTRVEDAVRFVARIAVGAA